MARFFNVPYLANQFFYDPGPQPFSPGESEMPWGGHQGAQFSKLPWPGAVPVLHVLANDPGTPRNRATIPVVNRYSPLPSDYMYLGNTVGKSKG